MRRNLFIGPVAVAFMTACGQAPSHTSSTRATDSTNPIVKSPDQSTGVGNEFNVYTQVYNRTDDGTSYSYNVWVTLSYHDVVGYMKSGGLFPDTITGVVGVNVVTTANGTASTATSWSSVQLVAEDDNVGGQYASAGNAGAVNVSISGIHGASDQVLDSVDLAFVGNGNWDSNWSQNYHVQLNVQ